jgi:hypothetical protein
MRKINVQCPDCKSNIEIILDDNFNIINVKSFCNNKLNTNKKHIEFGVLKK